MSPLAWPGIKVEGEEKGVTSAQAFVLLGSKTFISMKQVNWNLRNWNSFDNFLILVCSPILPCSLCPVLC